MSVEDRVRNATRARADLVREIRPLDLPVAQPRRLASVPLAGRLGAWAAPVAAAAVVVALAIALVTVREMGNEPSVPPSAPAVSALAKTVPEYYAELTGLGDVSAAITKPSSVVVGDDRTGRVLATVAPPAHQTFAGVTVAADDRTFVVEAWPFPYQQPEISKANPVAWYLLRVAPGSAHPVTLTRLPIPGLPERTVLYGLALSPDGSELAVMFQPDADDGSYPARPITLRVYSVRSGKAVRTWTGPANPSVGPFGAGVGRDSNTSITWLADGHTLAFPYGVTVTKNDGQDVFFDVTLRTLDLSRPGHDLLADSKAVLSLEQPQEQYCDTLQLTADGKTAVCGMYTSTAAGDCSLPGPRFLEYTIATGKPRSVYQLKGSSYGEGVADAIWASPSGGTLIGSAEAHCGDSYSAAGIIANGTLTPLRFPAGIPFAGEAAY